MVVKAPEPLSYVSVFVFVIEVQAPLISKNNALELEDAIKIFRLGSFGGLVFLKSCCVVNVQDQIQLVELCVEI